MRIFIFLNNIQVYSRSPYPYFHEHRQIQPRQNIFFANQGNNIEIPIVKGINKTFTPINYPYQLLAKLSKTNAARGIGMMLQANVFFLWEIRQSLRFTLIGTR